MVLRCRASRLGVSPHEYHSCYSWLTSSSLVRPYARPAHCPQNQLPARSLPHRQRRGPAATPASAAFTHLANSTQFAFPRNATEGIPYSFSCAMP